MRLVLVFGVVGQLLRYFSAAFLPPLALAVFESDWSAVSEFAFALLLSFVVGTLTGRGLPQSPNLHRDEALAVVAFTWLTLATFAAIPYLFEGLSPVDALFESMSGLTTTGATVLQSFDSHGAPFFLWRAMTQWFGGLGVIALFIAVLPRLGIAGRQLFFAEASSVASEAIGPRVRDVANRLWVLYTVLTAILAAALWVCGMTPYQALVHSLTTLSAGGFSPDPLSIAGYQNPAAEWVLIGFMILSGTSFSLQYRAFTGQPLALVRDREFQAYLGAAVLGMLGIAWALPGDIPDLDQLRTSAFQSASLISSTGFASTDYEVWPDRARVILILVMLVGGCAGSAAGGPKVVRHLLVIRSVRCEVTRVLHPRAVIPLRHAGKVVSDEVARAVAALVLLFAIGYVVSGLLLVLMGSDLVTAFSAALACLGNIGPGLGPVGPMGNYAALSTPAKLLLIVDMWIGRLEIVTVLALLHVDVWRYLRLR